jgi:hypothetical protein
MVHATVKLYKFYKNWLVSKFKFTDNETELYCLRRLQTEAGIQLVATADVCAVHER